MRQFWKQTLASLIGTLAAIFLFFVVGSSTLVLILLSGKPDTGVVKNKSVLVFDLSTRIVDTPPAAQLVDALAGNLEEIVTLRQVLDAIEAASKDENIAAILIEGSPAETENGYATLEEVKAALEEFRATGKKIYAYDVDWTESEYYLATVADEITINPIGAIELNGLSTQPLFLKGALDKYGIGVQVVKVGEYKSAVEPFTRTNLSDANRQQLTSLLGDIWNRYSQTVQQTRDISAQGLTTVVNQRAFLQPEIAQTNGLVDQIGYYDQVAASLEELTGIDQETNSFRRVRFADYVEAQSSTISFGDRLAVVYAQGSIVSGEGTGNDIASDRYVEMLREIRADDEIKAVVLRINSPGGSATASDIIWRELQLISEIKPVIVSMGDVAASGGYWIATAADYIFAQESTITGSIGVFGLLANFEEIANNNGLTWDTVKTGQFADITSSLKPKTEPELKIYQDSVEQIYDTFLVKVADARNLPKNRVAQIAQGRLWTGSQAQNIGLVDQIGGLDAAIAFAAEQANLGDDVRVEEYPQSRSFGAELLARLSTESSAANDPVEQQIEQIKSDLADLAAYNDPKGVYARLPFSFKLK